uniref:Alpha/beta hydrolase n=1 Tax=Candidatus Kentrum sp. LPFa TaxID=2126335 RepID=A0A450W8L6_9GAMM|nr:MAG: hypothetical protein BECKLPF1236A_GA0070988_1008613 [Candidatus Kentron sp. LPFa]VFK35445.1 MAG: hypothetical protein BECKLPF1236C_GA0070990_103754 [Candidatus Kentron sp. LPFa]
MNKKDYKKSCHALEKRLRKRVENNVWDKILFKNLYYHDILQGNQQDVFERMRSQIDWMRLRKFLLFGFSDAGSLEHKKHLPNSPYLNTQKMILKSMDEVFDEAGKVPVIILAQSLGAQVISNYIWDASRSGGKAFAGVWVSPQEGVDPDRDEFRRMRTVEHLYTTGCNIPIFVAGHKVIEPIKPPTNSFEWYNFFDEDDVLGWPLRPLSKSYANIVKDIPINAGGGIIGTVLKSWNPLGHTEYWKDKEVIKHLSRSIERLA